jgi:hypothetical protein
MWWRPALRASRRVADALIGTGHIGRYVTLSQHGCRPSLTEREPSMNHDSYTTAGDTIEKFEKLRDQLYVLVRDLSR